MKTVKINGDKYQVPSSHDEVTLDHFLHYERAEGTNLQREIEVVSYMTKIPKQIFYDAEKTLYIRIKSLIDGLFKQQPDQEPSTEITIDGANYYHDNFKTLILAQYVDIDFRLEEYKVEDGEDEDGNVKHRISTEAYPYILAILFLEAGEVYNSKVSAERAELFKSLPLDQALATVNFFLSKSERLKKIQQRSKEVRELAESMQSSKNSLHSNGVGLAQ